MELKEFQLVFPRPVDEKTIQIEASSRCILNKLSQILQGAVKDVDFWKINIMVSDGVSKNSTRSGVFQYVGCSFDIELYSDLKADEKKSFLFNYIYNNLKKAFQIKGLDSDCVENLGVALQDSSYTVEFKGKKHSINKKYYQSVVCQGFDHAELWIRVGKGKETIFEKRVGTVPRDEFKFNQFLKKPTLTDDGHLKVGDGSEAILVQLTELI